jgi:hypothetical protein
MLYDQALLARIYLHAWQVTGRVDHRQVAEETIDYVLTELRGDDAPEVRAWYGVSDHGNWEGTNIPRRPVFGALERSEAVERARRALLERRRTRVRPGLDDKVLAEWNGLMLATLAEAAAVLDRADWMEAARQAGAFLVGSLRRDDGRWMRSWQGGDDERAASVRHLAYAADHGALVDAFVRLAEVTGQQRWLRIARETADALLDLFWDDERDGVFTTGTDAPALVTRPKDLMDGATPSAQSLTAVALLRLGALTGDARYLDAADAILRLLAPVALEHPSSFGHLIGALDLAVAGPVEVVVTGDRSDLVAATRTRYRPDVVLAWAERDDDSGLWAGRADGFAYVCRNFACRQPARSRRSCSPSSTPPRSACTGLTTAGTSLGADVPDDHGGRMCGAANRDLHRSRCGVSSSPWRRCCSTWSGCWSLPCSVWWAPSSS